MSTRAFELLRQAELLSGDTLPVDLARYDEAVLREKLDFYYRARHEGAEASVTQDRAGVGEFAALRSSISCETEVDALLPSALVYHRFYVDDPLFRAAEPDDENTRVYNQYLGLRADRQINRERVDGALRYLAGLWPLVRGGTLL